ncbi:unnamed protein product [Arctia plantaginis]|uniref:Uncharacterized protein n=1 Tax=Arctia plantaginis TaxID=874455 RepID=A0A8S0YXP8_ARCPL|nr:unnamed protein product [Arctia plantaginis]
MDARKKAGVTGLGERRPRGRHAGPARRDILANPRGSTRRKPRCTGAPRVQRSGGPRRACPAPARPSYPRHTPAHALTPQPSSPHHHSPRALCLL